MDKNVSNNSATTNNNPSPPNTPPHTPNETNPRPNVEGLETIAKTSEEVLAELNIVSDEEISNENGDGGANEDGGAEGGVPRVMVCALTANVSNTSVVEQVGGDGHVQPFKKRKYNSIRDPPAGKPTCPECKREFASWRAAFGHMRKHPERPHRGFFPPPTFTPTAPVAGIRVAEDDGRPKKVDDRMLTRVRELVIDLNRSIGVSAESSGAGGSGGRGRDEEAPVPTHENEEGSRKNVFDLNELPPSDDDDEEPEDK
ncbi:zinc finger (C2H2 type)-like protein [Trifolium pratense]|uniref:Zinc finger (C2H2 type)-like protein n=1 Tax=Trifolium pratense TaxID=57577 RepID=A0A2K3N851_TRIPR|nr:zinc finger (C2H2 type)-like protein [Trifolium pratense]